MMYVVVFVDESKRHWDLNPPSIWQAKVYGPFASESAAEDWAKARWTSGLHLSWKAMPLEAE